MLGIVAITVFEPMAVLPYWCRTIRIYTIFKAPEYFFRHNKKPDIKWFKWIKESLMFKLSLIALSLLALISICLFVTLVFKLEVA